ncbi:MAG: type II secretion system F family protein [Candidatus Azambacteria bacterium]|nr:type II secretion system F family protein [Candidatus Azambacteria bacterium]
MQFSYQARTQQGDLKSGTIDAVTKEAALDALQRSNFLVIAINASSGNSLISGGLKFFRRVPRKEVVIFSRQIATLFEAKVPLIEALKTMMEQTSNPMFKDALLDIAKNVDAGAPLSKALAGHKRIFSGFYVSMVHSGEVSGKLEDIFQYLADGLEREYYLIQKVRGALTYPAFIIFGFGAIGFVMMVWVVPNLTVILKESGQELPFLTRAVIFTSDLFSNYWWALIIGIVGFIGSIFYIINTPQGKATWQRVQLKIPIFGKMFQKFYLARLTDNLSVLIQGGLPIVQALEITADVVNNGVYHEILLQTIEEVKKGNTMSSVFRTRKEIPVMVSQMVFVGEESGKLDNTLKSAAAFYQKEVTVVMDNLVTLIEPLLIMVLGVGVAIMVMAILMPMYDMAQNF